MYAYYGHRLTVPAVDIVHLSFGYLAYYYDWITCTIHIVIILFFRYLCAAGRESGYKN